MSVAKRGTCNLCLRDMMIHARGRCAKCYGILRAEEGNPIRNYRKDVSKFEEITKIPLILDTGEKASTTFQFCVSYLKNRGYKIQVKKDDRWIMV